MPSPDPSRRDSRPRVLASERPLRHAATIDVDGVPHPSVGRRIALLAKLGQGGMGVVYLGLHVKLCKQVAVKLLTLTQHGEAVERFLREAQLAARLESPHLVRVLDVDNDEATGHPFIVMEYVRGVSAGKWLRDVKRVIGAPPPESAVLRVALAAARGLAVAHSAGIVHRDIKPDNILIPEGDDGSPLLDKAKLADLGLAKNTSIAGVTTDTIAMGTPGFIAPEQVEDAKRVGPPADVFSLGATIYTLLSGEVPFKGPTPFAMMKKAVMGQRAPIAEVRDGLAPSTVQLVERCLETSSGERFADASALREALEECAAAASSQHATVSRAAQRIPASATPLPTQVQVPPPPSAPPATPPPPAAPQGTIEPVPTPVTVAGTPSKSGGAGKWVVGLLLVAALATAVFLFRGQIADVLHGESGGTSASGEASGTAPSNEHITPADGAPGHLDLSALPAGVQVFADGERTRRLTAADPIAVGRARLVLHRAEGGFADVVREIDVRAGERAPVHVGLNEFAPLPGAVSSAGLSDGLFVVLVGPPERTVTSDVELPPGVHEVEFRAEGRSPLRVGVTVFAEHTTRLADEIRAATGREPTPDALAAVTGRLDLSELSRAGVHAYERESGGAPIVDGTPFPSGPLRLWLRRGTRSRPLFVDVEVPVHGTLRVQPPDDGEWSLLSGRIRFRGLGPSTRVSTVVDGETIALTNGSELPPGVYELAVANGPGFETLRLRGIRIEAGGEAVVQLPAPNALTATLTVTARGPQSRLACDEFPLQVNVRNGGRAEARSVIVKVALPSGVSVGGRHGSASHSFGTLSPGTERTHVFTCVPSKRGTASFSVSVRADGAEAGSTRSSVRIVRPQLTLTRSRGGPFSVGAPTTVTLTVRNTGDGEARSVVLRDDPPGTNTLRSSSDGGRVASGMATWNLGTLRPGAARTVTAVYVPGHAASGVARARATAYCADEATASSPWTVE